MRMKYAVMTGALVGFILSSQAALICDLDATVPGSVVTNVSGVATDWVDQSGNGNNAGTETRIGNPTFPSASLSASGLAGVDFKSTRNGYRLFSVAEQDSWLDFTGAASAKSGFAVIAAVKVDAVTAGQRDTVFANHGSAANANNFILKYEGGQVTAVMAGETFAKSGGTPVTAGNTLIIAFNYNASTGAFELWDSNNMSSLTNSKAAANFSSGQPLYLGTSENGGQYIDGMMGEVLVYDEFLDATTFSNKYTELSEKWTVAAGILPPSGLSAIGVNSAVVLDWLDDGTGFLDFYTLYRGTASGTNNYVALTNLTDSAFIDTDVVNGTPYYYAVAATDTNGFETGFSEEVTATPITVSTNVVLYQKLDASVSASVGLANGNEVISWADQSGNGNDAIDSAGDPVLFPSTSLSGSGLAGLDVRTNRASLQLFDVAGTDDIMNFTGGASLNSGFAILVAFKADSVTGARDLVIGNASAITSGLQIRYDGGPMAAFLGGKAITKGDLLPVESGDTIVFALNYTASNGEMLFWDSKNDHTGVNTTAVAGDFTKDVMRLAGSNNGGQYMDGMIGEVQIYTSSLNASEFKSRRDALSDKWGAVATPKYNLWAVGWGVDIGSETNDFDVDGLNNLYEYGLNGNPTNGTVGPAVTPELVQGGSGLEYVHVQRNDDPSLIYTMESITDLVFGNWTNADSSVLGIGVYTNFYDTATNSVSTAEAQLFLRLKIEN